ncbi:hypothetical protein [Rhizobium sp. 42MFCr.1]|uniref:hypothetical protein n=1 Tax=Rhizobium sp. 42MFCr.1 TaxID=1048680 RepID=UPI00036EB277|nr:hypothetical protein [Rhizobium sp. 42MFCr.1]
MSKPYHVRPAGPGKTEPSPAVIRRPDGYFPGEVQFHVWRYPRVPDTFQLARGVIREYQAYGLLGWQSGPRASQLSLSRNWTLRLLMVDQALTAEAEVLLYPRAAKVANAAEPERGVVVTIPLSTPEEEVELRKLTRYVLRLAVWAGERLGDRFEAYLEDQGL